MNQASSVRSRRAGPSEGAAEDRHRDADEQSTSKTSFTSVYPLPGISGQEHEMRNEALDHEGRRADDQDDETAEKKMWKTPA